jgi:hypothetical protein
MQRFGKTIPMKLFPFSLKAAPGSVRCRNKFLRYFKEGFHSEKYIAWERGYKWSAHEQWRDVLGRKPMTALLRHGRFAEIAAHAVRIESRTNLLFSFEKMALRDAVKSPAGARQFAEGLHAFLYEKGSGKERFERWCQVVAGLPRRQTRVLTWPLVTIFGFLAQPEKHFFLKPNVTRRAAEKYGFEVHYESKPSWRVYSNLLEFAEAMRHDLADLHPRDMIDLQSFAWVQGSDEYP